MTRPVRRNGPISGRAVCPHCLPMLDFEAAKLLSECDGRTWPPRRHGHRLWLVPTSSSWWLFWCPSRDELPAVVGRFKRGVATADLSGARVATVADLRMIGMAA